MSLVKTNNLRKPELVKRISSFTNIEESISVILRCVLVKNNSDWSLLMGNILLNTRGDEVQECYYKYPNYHFICKSLNSIIFSKFLFGFDSENSLSILDFPDLRYESADLNWTESLIPSHASNDQFPIRRFSARVCSDVHCHENKLVAHGMAFHPSAFEYVREFLELDRFYGSSDGRKGELCIDISDQRGYLALSNEEIRYHRKSTDTLSVVGAIDGDPVNLSSSQDKYAFEQEKVSDVELWLVTDSDEIVDYCSSSEREYRYGAQTNNIEPTKLLQIITAGESEHCEFKQYIDLVSKKNNKAWDLDKAVCAFSNHQGGKLFIGVDDDTRIIGINDGCQQHYQCSPNEGAQRYEKIVTKRLQESLSKNQCFNTYLIEHNELFILVVDVHKANGLNYLLAKQEAYIRRGASSPKMTPSEIQVFPVERDALGRNLLKAESGLEWGSY